MSEENTNEEVQFEDSVEYYRFQKNILIGASQATQPVPMLDKISPTNEVPVMRLIYTIIAFALVLIATLIIMLSNTTRLGYMWYSYLPIFIGVMGLLLTFLVPSRNSSMLGLTSRYIQFYFTEGIRRKSKLYGRVRTSGLDDFMNGVMVLADGRVAVAYETVGQLGHSSIPSVAKRAAQARRNYFITREPTTEEITLTSIRESDVRSNERMLLQLREKNKAENTTFGKYRQMMAETQYRYTHNSMSVNDYTVSQALFIIEDDVKKLEKANAIFINALNSVQLYAQATQITSPYRLSEYITPLLLTSKRGALKDVQFIQKRYEQDQRRKGLR